ncbi:hypothetical protein H1W00_12845 [Aeromicrobium sp. Marseille-Q0843]|uniref:DUF6318 domain-containing protein n=1 Tax=Aeromicrobium phoceense TaxID=2754045 RepID=A0A838XL85_9ACTN|nr:hypothetical protein [Aeromicrobium phoceense]
MATLALTMSACGEDDPPPTEPTSAATTPANPDATLPPMPAVAQEFTPNGAATFVAHYVRILDYASKTGDVEELARLSSPSCEGCTRYVDLFRSLYRNGGGAEGRDWTRSATELRFQRDKAAETLATTTLRISAGTVQESADSAAKNFPATEDLVTFGLTYDEEWRITQFVTGGVE